MAAPTDRDGLRRLVRERNAQLVEVLPRREFEEEHLPSAMNIPLKALGRDAPYRLDRGRPVVVYCWDEL